MIESRFITGSKQLWDQTQNELYRIRKDNQKLFIQAWNEMQKFKNVTIKHIRREFNKEADAEVNKVLDEKEKKS